MPESLWFAPETLGRVSIGRRVQITTREWNDPRLGLARPHALVTLGLVQAPLPAWWRLETPIAFQQRAIGDRKERLHRQVWADLAGRPRLPHDSHPCRSPSAQPQNAGDLLPALPPAAGSNSVPLRLEWLAPWLPFR